MRRPEAEKTQAGALARAPAPDCGRPQGVSCARRTGLLGLLVLLAACGGAMRDLHDGHAAADLVLVGGTVYTMNPLAPRAEGVAVRDGEIAAVGSAAEVRRWVGPKTRVIELDGGAVVPGLVDAHAHLHGLGRALETLALRGVGSADAVVAQVRAAAAGRGAGEWIEGRGWDENLWPGKQLPGRGLLDGVAQPVALRRIDGHALWANAAALRLAGITRASADPPGGRIVRDASGDPTGVLVDEALELVEQRMPAPDAAVIRRRILAAQAAAVAAGLTGVHEMGISDAVIAVYRQLAAEGALRLRVYAFRSGGPLAAVDRDVDGRATFVLGGVKLYADGSLGSRSAALLAPYQDNPANSGLVISDGAALTAAARAARAGGWQLAVHAIGDRANRAVLDAYRDAGVPPERRFRIEHAQVVAPPDFARFAAQGVIASMQPTHATSDMAWAEARLGPERVAGAYAWRTMLAAGVHVAFGSDVPVEEVAPLLGLWAAVARADRAGQPAGGWHPEQRLTLDEALHAFTVEPAYASFQEEHRGRVAPGFVADLTVFDRDLVAEHLLDARVAFTVLGGLPTR
jgi:predicted amidohydrolase YtcJ